MARRTEPALGTQKRLDLDLGRYWRVFRFVRDRLLDGGGSKDAAYSAAEANLGKPYSTVKKH